MKYYLIIFFSLFTILSSSQTPSAVKQILIKKSGYSIKAPETWTIDSTGIRGTDLFIFSSLKDSSDTFSENVNVIIQDLPGTNFTMDNYVDISEKQIGAYFEGSQIFESNRVKSGSPEYHKLIYSGKMNNRELKFEQYYFIKNNKAFVITYTAEASKFEEYKSIAEQILNSFKFD